MPSPSRDTPPYLPEDNLTVGCLGTEAEGSELQDTGDKEPDAPIGKGAGGDGELSGEGDLGAESPEAERERHGGDWRKESADGGREILTGLGQDGDATGCQTIPHGISNSLLPNWMRAERCRLRLLLSNRGNGGKRWSIFLIFGVAIEKGGAGLEEERDGDPDLPVGEGA